MKNFTLSLKCEEEIRRFIDVDTGEVASYKLITIGNVECLVPAKGELPPEVTTNTRRGYKPKYVSMYPAMRKLLMEGNLTNRELRVLAFLLDNLPWGNRVQVTQRVIADALGIARSHVSTALKGLKEKEVIVEDVDPLVPNTPVYLIDPIIAFCGSEESQEFKRKAFIRKYKAAIKRP